MMRRVVTCLAFAVAVAAFAVSSYARTVDQVIPLGGAAEGTVASGKAATVGILLPAGARKVSVDIRFDRKSGLDPLVSLYAPDGSEITPDAIEAAGGKLKASSSRIGMKKLPVPVSGLYKLVLRGKDGTAGDYRLKCRGGAAKFPKSEGELDTPAGFVEYRVDVPDGSFLTVNLGPAKGSELVPDIEVRTAGGHSLDLGEYVRRKKAKTSLRKLPLPFFGGYILRVVSAEGAGGYKLAVKVKAKKIKDDPDRPVADAGDVVVIRPGETTVLAGDGSPGATFAWERVSGEGADLSDADVATPSFTARQEGGTHAFQLVTTLNGVLSIADTAVVEVNQPPVAVGGPSRSVETDATVTLDGTESFDLDSDHDLDYLWRQISGPSVTLAGSTTSTASFAAPSAAGVLVFELVVSDGFLASEADRVVIGVNRIVADAGRPVVVTPKDSVWLSGLRTPGSPDEFAWSRIDTESPSFQLAVTDEPVTGFSSPRQPGIYRFRLIVDGEAAAADEVIVIVSNLAANGEPRANAPALSTSATGAAFTLTSGSTDPDGDALRYEWRQIAGAATPLSGAGGSRSGTTPDSADVLRFLLMVHDGRKYGPPDQATIAVGSPTAPIAHAGLDGSGQPGDSIVLDSSGSTAATGRAITSRHWSQLTGNQLWDVAKDDAGFDETAIAPSITVPTTISSLTPDRSILFALTVTDDNGAESEADFVVVTFEDLPGNAQPSVTAAADPELVRPGAAVSLVGTADDADGDPLTYAWEQLSGPETAALTDDTTDTATLIAPATAGQYTFRLTVSDGTGEPNGTASAIARLRVNAAPVIVATVTPPQGPPGTTVTLDGSGTTDPDGDTLTWSWAELPTGNPSVPIVNAETSTASFLAPPFPYGKSIAKRTRKYRLTVADSLGPVSADVVFVPNTTPTTAGMTVSKVKIRYDATDPAVFTLPSMVDVDG
ncbi:MAG: REJ domain-containing protein, partial [Planctomycetota bacterium]